jgi:ATPase subunit of ABC transporter with duplicated ATPase domains
MDQFPEHLIQLDTIDQFFTELKVNKLFDIGLENTFKNRLSRFGIQWDQVKDQKGLNLPWAMLRSILVVLLSHCRFDVLILDEPTFGLGWDQRVILRSFLRECMTNMHFMIVSHDRTFIESLCDNIVNLDTLDIEKHSIGISKKTKS